MSWSESDTSCPRLSELSDTLAEYFCLSDWKVDWTNWSKDIIQVLPFGSSWSSACFFSFLYHLDCCCLRCNAFNSICCLNRCCLCVVISCVMLSQSWYLCELVACSHRNSLKLICFWISFKLSSRCSILWVLTYSVVFSCFACLLVGLLSSELLSC